MARQGAPTVKSTRAKQDSVSAKGSQNIPDAGDGSLTSRLPGASLSRRDAGREVAVGCRGCLVRVCRGVMPDEKWLLVVEAALCESVAAWCRTRSGCWLSGPLVAIAANEAPLFDLGVGSPAPRPPPGPGYIFCLSVSSQRSLSPHRADPKHQGGVMQ